MPKPLLLCCCICLLSSAVSFAQTNTLAAPSHTEPEIRKAWNVLKSQPVTEDNFRSVCDLAQESGRSNISLYYEMIEGYIPLVRASGDRRKLHILLMSLAKTKVALGLYEEGEGLYQQIHANAGDSVPFLRGSLVGTVIMYSEWGQHPDSLSKYFPLAERHFRETDDKEALSFIYTFKSLSLLNQPQAVRDYLEKAIRLSAGLSNKNALFTARYNYTLAVLQNNPQQQIAGFEQILELSKDSSLIPNAKLYSGRLYSFGLATMSVYYQLTQLNLLLTDYGNAGKYGQLFYDMTIKNYPHGADVPYISAELSIVKSYQGEYAEARRYLDTSRVRFSKTPEDSIPYADYFIAAGMLAEHAGDDEKALALYERAHSFGNESYGLTLMPPGIYYAHALVLNHKIQPAEKVFTEFEAGVKARKFTALGFYYYKYYADFLKSKSDYPGYTKALETFYAIKDSLTNINQYRAIQEIETKMSVREKEQQIILLNGENAARIKEIRLERIAVAIFLALAAVIIGLLVRQRNRRHRIDIMQGAIDASENERHSIADQLHDETGGMLALASLNISSALEKGKDDLQSEEKIKKAHEIMVSVSSAIRDISHRLTPLVIEKVGFRKAIEDMDHAINLSGKLQLETVIIGFDDTSQYPVTLLNNLYRMIQELLHNVLKHAGATHVLLELVEHEDHLSIMVEDNGKGMTPDGEDGKGADGVLKGKGLRGIQSKIDYLKGKMEINNNHNQGTLIVLEIPV
jgi:signal transduction histidine kinase